MKITVLMSTYNGSKYLKEQIESLKAQNFSSLQIIVRDDGSTDSTCQILDEYQNQSVLTWYSGENLKPAMSFMNLLQNSPESDYYAFCDQDDYWMPNKLDVAICHLQGHDEPSLYCSNTILANSNLNTIGISNKIASGNFFESLVTSPVTGCTAVFNRRLRDICISYKPKLLNMHDWWIYQICLAVGGNFYFDKLSFILYRQHDNNVIGGVSNKSTNVKRHLLLTVKKKDSYIRHEMATELSKGFLDIMPATNVDILNNCVHYKDSWFNTLKFAFSLKNSIVSLRIRINFILAVLLRKF